MSPDAPSDQPRVLISRESLARRIEEMAAEIDRDYGGKPAPLCIGVLKGSVFFMVDLLQRVKTPVTIDFLQTSAYRSGTRPGDVQILKDVEVPIRDRDVLLIEDIVDTGHTLNTVLDLIRFRGARSVRLCALLDKVGAREVEVPIHYCGFQIDNVFVVGYGLDLDERFRNLPYVGIYEGEPPAPAPAESD